MKRPPLPIVVAIGLLVVSGIANVVLSTPAFAVLTAVVHASMVFNVWRGRPRYRRLPFVVLAINLLALILRPTPFILLSVLLWAIVALLVSLPKRSRAWFLPVL